MHHGVIRIGFSYKPGYQLCIWQDNDYDHPFIEFDDIWKPVMLETQNKFAHKLHNWLITNARFGSAEVIKSDPMTHNFKSWRSIKFAEATHLKTMPEGATTYMDIAMQLVKERNKMIKIPKIKNVLFNDTKRTTTVLFDDDTITMSKTTDGETYDHEVGFAMCIMKKMYGNRTRFQKEIERWTTACENTNKKIADKAAKKQDKDKEIES